MNRHLIIGLVSLPTLTNAETPDDLTARGAYLATVMDCAGCHMPRGSDGMPLFHAGLSGGTVGFEIPGMGIFWAPNLTPADTGLRSWTDAEIAVAITAGQHPDGRTLAPVMPWPAYVALTDEDVAALVAYLRSLPPVDSPRIDSVAGSAEAVAPYFSVVLP
jgi:mono/diheme cytochrome c family protein